MATLKTPTPTRRNPQRRRRLNLLVLAGLPLVLMHLGLLLERALRQEIMDGLTATRWLLSVGLLFLLRRFEARELSFRSPTVAIAAILIFALIHAPVASPEPALPLAATALGLALALVVLERFGGVGALMLPTFRLARPLSGLGSLGLSHEGVKDRAPPAFA